MTFSRTSPLVSVFFLVGASCVASSGYTPPEKHDAGEGEGEGEGESDGGRIEDAGPTGDAGTGDGGALDDAGTLDDAGIVDGGTGDDAGTLPDAGNDDGGTGTGSLRVVASIAAGGSFGYDATADRIVAASVGGVHRPPQVTITLATLDFVRGNDPEGHCEIVMTYTGVDAIVPSRWSFTYEGTAYDVLGFVMPDGQYDLETSSCAGFDTSRLGPPADIAASGWGIGVGNLRPDVEQAVVAQYGEVGERVGGGFYWTIIAQSNLGLDDGYSPYGHAIGYQTLENQLLNASLEVASASDVANGNLLPVAGADVIDGTVPAGWYEISHVEMWHFNQ